MLNSADAVILMRKTFNGKDLGYVKRECEWNRLHILSEMKNN